MKKIVVFDFDKTLTYVDTILPFFKFCAKKDIKYPFKLGSYYALMVLAKFGYISNFKLKDIGIKLFLKNLDKNKFERLSKDFKNHVKLNTLYYETDFSDKNIQYYIISASFENYLKHFFPSNVKIIGSKIKFENNKPVGLLFNCYKQAKLKALKKEGINQIDIFYTDSFSDYPLAKISDKVVIVDKDKKFMCRDFEEFKRYFKK